MTRESASEVALAFIHKWETTYNSQSALATAQLYAPDAVLVGFVIAAGQSEIGRLLGAIMDQGWCKVSIKLANAREVAGVILAACEYSATGTGPNAGKTLGGKSSYVLSGDGNTWLCAMHTAA